ncbi:MAG: putative F420-dependent oxidoreductase [Gammaproteobacteria bacterium]|jgi:probable F420-dependent oxidoreductase
MKLGLYSSIANPPRGDDLDRCVEETLNEAVLAEQCGFGGVFFGEHHQDKDGFLPSPLVVCAAAAARTKTIDIGTSVILLPLHHPVRTAEDAVTLDIISGGRAKIGVGLGYQSADFRMFGVDQAKRRAIYEECIDVVRKCWSGEPFSFRGEHFQMDDVQMLPRPMQRPMPLWIGAWAPAAVKRAAHSGDGWIIGPSMSLEQIEPLAALYRAEAAAAGKPANIILMRDGWVSRSRDEATQVYGPEVLAAYKYYWRNGALAFEGIRSESDFTLENLAPGRLILGEPAECVDQLHEWQERLGVDYVLLRLRHAHSGGPAHEKITEAIELFGRAVIPQLGG